MPLELQLLISPFVSVHETKREINIKQYKKLKLVISIYKI